jgi:quinol monooxygenase YgiN
MNRIQVNARFTDISRSNLAEFRKAAAQAMEIATSEPGVLQYDWFFDDTQTVCIVRETYRDSQALLAHITTVGEALDTLTRLAGGCELEMFGEPSAQVVDVTALLQRSIFRSSFQSK